MGQGRGRVAQGQEGVAQEQSASILHPEGMSWPWTDPQWLRRSCNSLLRPHSASVVRGLVLSQRTLISVGAEHGSSVDQWLPQAVH